jgi:hypothetical protein|tara:strand:+ start:174 stop:575 length:402 start_codon:yes stop_codon:yes gene_type:complete
MNKTELKKILKPLIKQCIKEVIFEDGTLSNIVSEVARGLGSTPVITETRTSKNKKMNLESESDAKARLERKKRMLDAIGKDAFNGVDLFEGTTPAPPQREQGQGALSGVDPRDPGVDISNFASSGMWKKLAGN